MIRGAFAFAIAVLAILAMPALAEDAPVPFDRAGWLFDLGQLRDAMSSDYANLEWAVAVRGMDLKATYAEAQRGIEAAADEAAARKALGKFLAAFADGHIEIHWKAAVPEAVPDSSGAAPLCERLGYFDVGESGAVATHLRGFHAIGANPESRFPVGLVSVAGRRVGILRVPVFMPQGFPDICASVIAAVHLTPSSPCDGTCKERLGKIADERYMAGLEAQLHALLAAKPDVLLLDLAGNGGGNDSALAMARMLSGRDIHPPRMGFVRGARWAKEFAGEQSSIDSALATAPEPAHAFLAPLRARLVQAQKAALMPCDRSALWDGRPIACSAIVAAPRYAAGLLTDRLPAAYRGEPWAETVSSTVRFHYTAKQWRGPLIVLIDGNSASASELLAAMVQDNHAGLVIGAPSYGAGCGHGLEHQPIVLKHSGGRVLLPDCVFLRDDGRDEVGGIDPDMLIGFHDRTTAYQRAQRLEAALPAAVARAVAGR